MNSGSPDTPWLLSQKKAMLGSQWLKFKQLLGWWSQRKTQLRTRIKRITPCLIVSEKTNRETEKVEKCLLSLADGLKERPSLGTELWIEFLLCIRRVWKWNQSAQPMEKFGHWISLIIEATSCRKKIGFSVKWIESRRWNSRPLYLEALWSNPYPQNSIWTKCEALCREHLVGTPLSHHDYLKQRNCEIKLSHT